MGGVESYREYGLIYHPDDARGGSPDHHKFEREDN